jgi:teichuronic acid biosynthesis glycosyltransferase TuaG
MPVYNAENFIDEAILSVINQTFVNWALILVDDCSNDNSATKCQFYASSNDNIFYFKLNRNSKQAIARNYGISESKGEYVAFMDADDIWHPMKLEIINNHLKLNSNIHIICSDMEIFKTQFKNFDFQELVGSKDFIEFKADVALKKIIEANFIGTSTVVIKKHLLHNFSFRNDFVPAEDYDLWLRLILSNNSIYYIPLKLTFYRIVDGSSSSNDRGVYDKVFLSIIKNIPKKRIANLLDKDLLNRYLKFWFTDYYERYPKYLSLYSYYKTRKFKFYLFFKFFFVLYFKKKSLKYYFRLT